MPTQELVLVSATVTVPLKDGTKTKTSSSAVVYKLLPHVTVLLDV
jgi:hypothetical protein